MRTSSFISVPVMVNSPTLVPALARGFLYMKADERLYFKNDQGVEELVGPHDPSSNAYTHVQGTPLSVWTIVHPLIFRPNITVVDSTGRQVEGDVVYTSATIITVTFSGAFSGTAYLS